MSNITVRSKLEFYPHDGAGRSAEFWHGDKFFDPKSHLQLTPMTVSGNTMYYVDEICQLADGSLFIPDMFLRRGGDLWARGHQLIPSNPVSSFVQSNVSICKLSDAFPHKAFRNQYTIAEGMSQYPLTQLRQNCISLHSVNMEGLFIIGGSSKFF
jgi:hypothetical protein